MGKLFQNNIESEIVAGYFNEEALKGLFLNGDYFQIAKKNLSIYHGYIYSDTEHDDPSAYFSASANLVSDEDFVNKVLGNDIVPDVDVNGNPTGTSTPIPTTKLEVKSFYDYDIPLGEAPSGSAYFWAFIAVPADKVSAGFHIIEKQTQGNQVPLLRRDVEIEGVNYAVFYGFTDAPLTVICKEN